MLNTTQAGLTFSRRIVTRDIFFSEGDRIIQGKVFKFLLRIFKRENYLNKFIRRSLGIPAPYPSTSVPELNDTTRLNQYRARIPSPL